MEILAFLVGMLFGAVFVAAVEAAVLSRAFDLAVGKIADQTRAVPDGQDTTTAAWPLSDPDFASLGAKSTAGSHQKAAAPVSGGGVLPTSGPPSGFEIPASVRPRCGFCTGVRRFFKRNQQRGKNGA